MWPFQIIDEGWESSIIFKGADKLVNIDCVYVIVLGGCVLKFINELVMIFDKLFLD